MTTADTPNEYELRNRAHKATRIAMWLRNDEYLAEDIIEMNAAQREVICGQIGVKPASAETWAAVIGIMGALETQPSTQVDADPFAGLPGHPFR